jgi:hypothetical protein
MSIRFPRSCRTPAQRSEFARSCARKRWAKVDREPRADLPDLVRRIVIEDFAGGVKHTFDLHRCNRIDQYRVVVDGRLWKSAAGLSVILAGLRKAWGRYGRFDS